MRLRGYPLTPSLPLFESESDSKSGNWAQRQAAAKLEAWADELEQRFKMGPRDPARVARGVAAKARADAVAIRAQLPTF